MLTRVSRPGLWVLTILVVLLSAVQALSGHWVVFFFLWPGGTSFGSSFMRAMADLGSYHRSAGFAIAGLAVLILLCVFLSRWSVYVRLLAVLGLVLVGLSAWGGYQYYTSGYQDRWFLGQMADASVGVIGIYLIQLFFMNKTPRFPWSKSKTGA
jgi:hypothetical protein